MNYPKVECDNNGNYVVEVRKENNIDKEYIEAPFTLDKRPTFESVVDELEQRIDSLERRNAGLKDRIDYLTDFIRDYCVKVESKEELKENNLLDEYFDRPIFAVVHDIINQVNEHDKLINSLAHQINRIVLYLASVQKACEQGENEE